MAIRIRLRELRRAAGLTQVQLSQRCGMPQSTISRIESGTTSGVDFDTLDRVASALGVHPSELIGFDEVVLDHEGRTYVVRDVTAGASVVPEGATTVWTIEGTNLTFGTGPGAPPGRVIAQARKLLERSP